MKKPLSIALFLAGVILSFGAGVFFARYSPDGTESPEGERLSLSGGYNFINPLLECEVNTLGAHQKYIPFEKETKEKIKTEIQDKNPDVHLSVYFRNLNNGPWFGINEEEDFSPASLMKLPILMIYLKWSEYAPEILEKKIKIETLSDTTQLYQPEKRLEVGKEYTVSEALYYLIVYSDNTAVGPLLGGIPEEIEEKVLGELGLPSISKSIKNGTDYILSVKDYASFYRVLYNASYIRGELSEGALRLLSESTFNEGIRANIPQDIVIAHKFGERETTSENGTLMHQLHDCGIVYYKNYPYLLCVITKGNIDYKRLASIIQGTSDIIYDEISKKYLAQ